MYPQLELLLFVFLLLTALVALLSKNLLTAVVVLSIFSFLSALIYAAMGAVDVAFTEAVVGGGISGVLFIVTVFKTSRRSID